jgi:hydroxymethylbilane synthase
MLDVKKIIIGARASKLAIKQAEEVKKNLLSFYPDYKNHPHLIEIVTFRTTGDKITDRSLVEIGGKGLFIKEIEEALLTKRIDIAVHSMKDMPAFFSEGLDIFATPQRQDARDAFISHKYSSINNLPQNAIVGTCSPRRTALILNRRPDLKIVNFRGNVDTRLEKLRQNQADATILAVAGLNRVNLQDRITKIIETNEMLPAVGQGALAIQARSDNNFIIDLVDKINHQESCICIKAERSFQKTINGSCHTPLSAYCQIKDNKLDLKVLIATLDGREIYQTSRIGDFKDAEKIGISAGEEIKKNAKYILDSLTL